MADYDFELRADIPRVLVEAVPGEALSVSLPILDADNAAVPVSGTWSALVQLRAQYAATTVLHTFTTAGGSPNASVTAGSAGAVVLTATAAENAAWQTAWTNSPQAAVGDVFVTDNTSVAHCIADLVVALRPHVTRS